MPFLPPAAVQIAAWRQVAADTVLRTRMRYVHPHGPSTISAVQFAVCLRPSPLGRVARRAGRGAVKRLRKHLHFGEFRCLHTSSVTPKGVPPSPKGKAFLPDKLQFEPQYRIEGPKGWWSIAGVGNALSAGTARQATISKFPFHPFYFPKDSPSRLTILKNGDKIRVTMTKKEEHHGRWRQWQYTRSK